MYMNWTRAILDGLAMAAYFNLFAAAVALYKPRLMFPCYPPAIKLLPLLLYGAVSTVEGGTTGFWRLALTG